MSDMLWHNINIMKKKKATLSEQFKSPIKFVDIEISLLDRVGKGIPIKLKYFSHWASVV
jgi:hypothetical protein